MTEAAQKRRRPGQAEIGIVDDDESVCLALAAWLRSIGIASQTFTSGGDLLDSEQLAHFSCLIMDERMRGMTGLQTLRALRQCGCEAPVIIISAYGNPEMRQRAAAAGAFAFFDKPFSELSLKEAIFDALEAGHGGPIRPAQ